MMIAILAVTGGALLADWLQPAMGWMPLALALAAATLIAAVGLADDIYTIEIIPRLLFQILVAALAVASLPESTWAITALPWWLERVTLAVALVWFINLTNFMDGLDWMTVSEAVPITAAIAILGPAAGLPAEAIVTALALCGALIGFAPFNRPTAKLFLGDVGSLAIGVLIGWLLLLLAGNGHIAAALLLPLYYLADATVTLVRRTHRGERFWEAHRDHFYQRATAAGLSVGTVLGRIFATNLALAALAGATIWFPSPVVEMICLALGSALVAALLRGFARGRQASLA